MHQDVGKLVDEIDEISKVSEQSNDNVQSVAASTQEQNAAMEEVAAASTHLAKMAIDLQGTVAAFKYGEIGDRYGVFAYTKLNFYCVNVQLNLSSSPYKVYIVFC